MNILFTGKGSSGSWQCRGVQLGGAVGKVIPTATLKECEQADVIVCVKRINQPWFQNVKQSGTPWIWDLVDFYPQPECSRWTPKQAIAWVREQINIYQPYGIIWPNKRMQNDCDLPGIVIYHHARPKIEPNPIRETIKTVAYEGSTKYPGRWHEKINAECRRRGWNYVVNPERLADIDIVLAFRDGVYNGYVQEHWKSNVKLANAHGSGTPFIGPMEPGYIETASGFEKWVEHDFDLSNAFDELEPKAAREIIHYEFLHNRIELSDCAKRLVDYAGSLQNDRRFSSKKAG